MIHILGVPSSYAPQVKTLPQRPGPMKSTFLHTHGKEKRVNAAKYILSPKVQPHPKEEELPIKKRNAMSPGRNMYLKEKLRQQIPQLSRLLT